MSSNCPDPMISYRNEIRERIKWDGKRGIDEILKKIEKRNVKNTNEIMIFFSKNRHNKRERTKFQQNIMWLGVARAALV